ncbi:hypothetical protein [Actinopolymorpha pittospori]|uniref:Uncharacterized protein n=1 Tax=Actinopolymorpha pittospori TaxID=648752 RepID=A0A927RAQ5_9ACTN|nr:hypothetical protein [Actinopolymorpha pittospori]MBE1605295.1 hypothetical protein [Actinopolymorpha pittospori]
MIGRLEDRPERGVCRRVRPSFKGGGTVDRIDAQLVEQLTRVAVVGEYRCL